MAPEIPTVRVWHPTHLPVAEYNQWLFKRRTKRSLERGRRLAERTAR